VLLFKVVDQGADSVSAYFPKALWYSISRGSFDPLPIDATAGGKYVNLATPLTESNAHVRGGSIVPMQEAAMTTTQARQSAFTLLVALCPKGNAHGSLFWDDGEQVDIVSYLSVDFAGSSVGQSGSVVSTVGVNSYSEASNLRLDTIVVLGPNLACPTLVTINAVSRPDISIGCTFADNNSHSRIVFSKANLKLTDNFNFEWL
jgi:alpha-glucosidase (family GH31 glycosyl hydrolase)